MFIITNRKVNPEKSGLAQLSGKPTVSEPDPDPINPKGPNELRVVEAFKSPEAKGWDLKILDDEIKEGTPEYRYLQEVNRRITGGADEPAMATVTGKKYASEYAAYKILERVNPKMVGLKNTPGRNLLFFVHGFNNDVEAVLERAAGFEEEFGVEVLAFSWPANGGGIRGTLSYYDDKRDARASVGALDRTLVKIYALLRGINERYMWSIIDRAEEKFSADLEAREAFITTEAEKGCPFKVSMLAHSMGNYLYKKLLQSSAVEGNKLLFDNVILAAADTNNAEHAQWVDQIACRNRVYITINEKDKALRISRFKAGAEQQARLGHYLYNLYSTQSAYIDFTRTPHVGDSHAYFEGKPLRNESVREFFKQAVNGETAELDLRYDPGTRMHRFRK